MGLFSKSQKKKGVKEEEKLVLKVDQIIFEKLSSDDDQYLTSLAQKMMNGFPVILNFSDLDIDQANKVIAFLSGVIYAISGEIVSIQEKVFMFADKDVYDDGSMEEFLKDFVE
jgi:cell division inhibitor SepF